MITWNWSTSWKWALETFAPSERLSAAVGASGVSFVALKKLVLSAPGLPGRFLPGWLTLSAGISDIATTRGMGAPVEDRAALFERFVLGQLSVRQRQQRIINPAVDLDAFFHGARTFAECALAGNADLVD